MRISDWSSDVCSSDLPARKLFVIVRALPDGSKVAVSQTGDKVIVQAGRSRFTLASLSANDFPSVDEVEATERVSVPEAALKELIERTAFAMAQQDVRYYLNGQIGSASCRERVWHYG